MEAEAIPVIICRRHLLDGDWRTLAKWGQQRHRPLKVIVVSKAGDKTLQTAAEEGMPWGTLHSLRPGRSQEYYLAGVEFVPA